MPQPPTRRPPDFTTVVAHGRLLKTQKGVRRNDPKPSRRTPSTKRRCCAALQFAQADGPTRGAEGHEGTAAIDRGLEAVFIQRALRYYREVGGDAPTRRAGVHLQTNIRSEGDLYIAARSLEVAGTVRLL